MLVYDNNNNDDNDNGMMTQISCFAGRYSGAHAQKTMTTWAFGNICGQT